MVVMVQTSNGSNRAQSKSSPVKTQQRLLLNTRKSLFALRGGQATDLKSKTRNKSRFASKLVYQHDKNSGDKNTGQIERLDFVRRKAALLHALGFLYGASKIVGTNKQKMVNCFCTECFLTRSLLKLWVVFLFYILPILNVIPVNLSPWQPKFLLCRNLLR